MKLDFNTHKHTTNFGMALHMNEARIERRLGKNMADGAREARPRLEELAQNCEVYVRSFKFPLLGADSDCYRVRVTKKFESPILKFLNSLFNPGKHALTHDRFFVNLNKQRSFSSAIINAVENMKKAL